MLYVVNKLIEIFYHVNDFNKSSYLRVANKSIERWFKKKYQAD